MSAGAMSILFAISSQFHPAVSHRKVSGFHTLMLILFSIYLSIVFALTVSPIYGFSAAELKGTVNLIPFQVWKTIGENPLNFFGNIAMFIPLGFFLVLLSDKYHKAWRTIFMGVKISLLIELIQLFETRGTDIDDVILNTAGTFAGFAVGHALLAVFPQLKKHMSILLMKGETLCRKKLDTRDIHALILLVLVMVFSTGFSYMSNYETSHDKPSAEYSNFTSAPEKVPLFIPYSHTKNQALLRTVRTKILD